MSEITIGVSGVTIIPSHARDWVGDGALSDGLHPGDYGNDLKAWIVAETLSNQGN